MYPFRVLERYEMYPWNALMSTDFFEMEKESLP